MDKVKTWYITDASKGIGRMLAKKLLDSGHNVAAVNWNPEDISDTASGKLLSLSVDLNDEDAISESLYRAHTAFGAIDVVLNNAAYAIGGSIEELSSTEIMHSLNINLLATIRVIQNVLPYLRQQRSGHIINISAISGFSSGAPLPLYTAAKYAVNGISEALAQDVAALGIKVSIVTPGEFNTDMQDETAMPFAAKAIADYKNTRKRQQQQFVFERMRQGDYDKITEALLKISSHPNPPLYLFLGNDAHSKARNKIRGLSQILEQWKDITHSIDYEIGA